MIWSHMTVKKAATHTVKEYWEALAWSLSALWKGHAAETTCSDGQSKDYLVKRPDGK